MSLATAREHPPRKKEKNFAPAEEPIDEIRPARTAGAVLRAFSPPSRKGLAFFRFYDTIKKKAVRGADGGNRRAR